MQVIAVSYYSVVQVEHIVDVFSRALFSGHPRLLLPLGVAKQEVYWRLLEHLFVLL